MEPLMFSKQFAIWSLGTMGTISLIAAGTNAFNGALIARRPDHYKNFTVAGIILLAFAGGIGGGVLRDILVNVVPAPLQNPWYFIVCVIAAGLALIVDYFIAQKFRAGLLAFATAFTLPWYAIVGADTAVKHGLGYFDGILVGVIATTGGRFIIDISCGQIPKQLVRGEFFILTAVLTAALYLTLNKQLQMDAVPATAIAVVFGCGFRLLCQFFGWEEWEPWEPSDAKAMEKVRHKLGADLKEEFGKSKSDA